MGARLRKANIIPDLIISSAAMRTRQTTAHLVAALGVQEQNIQWEEKLYHCVPAVLEEVIYALPQEVRTVFIVAHNPGITEFANQLSPDFYTGNMPTCSIVGVHFDSDNWFDFDKVKKEVFLYDYPKNEHESE